MIKHFLACSIFFLLATSLQAQSFFYGSVYVQGGLRNPFSKSEAKLTYHFAPGRFSLVMDNFMQDSTLEMSFGIIVNTIENFTCVLDRKAKKYDCTTAVKSRRKQNEEYYRPLAGKRRILGYDCSAYVNDYRRLLTGNEDSTMLNLLAALDNIIYWVADSLRIDTETADGLDKIELATIMGRLVMAEQSIQSKQDTITINQVLHISASMPDSSLFQIPAGYTRMKAGGKSNTGDPGSLEGKRIQDAAVKKSEREPLPPPPSRKPARKPVRKQ